MKRAIIYAKIKTFRLTFYTVIQFEFMFFRNSIVSTAIVYRKSFEIFERHASLTSNPVRNNSNTSGYASRFTLLQLARSMN